MGIALTIPQKTVVARYNECWAVNIQSANNPSSPLFADPVVSLFFRERTVYSDGSNVCTNETGLTTPEFVPSHSFKMSSAVMRSGDMAYYDKTGTLKSIPLSDIPLTVKTYLDFIGTEVRAARAAELVAQEPEPEPTPET